MFNSPKTGSRLPYAVLLIALLAVLASGLNYLDDNKVRPFVPNTTPAHYLDIQVIQNQWHTLIKQHQLTPTNQLAAAANQTSPLLLVHLWNPSCFCNAVSQRHVAEVLQQFDQTQIQWWVITPSTTSDRQIDQYRQLNPRIEKVIRIAKDSPLPVTASPALAITSQNGQLHYYGAYGFGIDCTPSGDNFFANMINNIRAGVVGPFLNIAGQGCFCPWPT